MSFYCGGKYVSDEDFGENGVIKAKNKFTGEDVGIKRWKGDCAGASCEIDAWKSFNKQFFVESYFEDGYVYLVHKWIDGLDLGELCLSKGFMPEAEAIELILKICGELERFYSCTGLVFGDLKPENIILCGESIYLIDFESAFAETDEGGTSADERISSGRTIQFASKAYCAPEIYHGERYFSSDVYSLGMILLFLVTGVPSHNFVDRLSEPVGTICRKCILQEKDGRFLNVSELAEAIKDINVPCKVEVEELSDEVVGGAKVVVFPKNMVGYRRIIVYVPQNAAFAAELAYMSARYFGMKTCVFDVNEFYEDRLKHYLKERDSVSTRGDVMVAEDGSSGSTCKSKVPVNYFAEDAESWLQNGLILRCDGADDFYMSSCNIVKEMELFRNDVRDFAVWCYSEFDITVVVGDLHLDEQTKADFMRYSDYVVMPVKADIDALVFEKCFITKFMNEALIPLSKLRYVGWDFAEEDSVEHEAMVMSLGENIYLGTVSQDSKRRRIKNVEGRSYCEEFAPKLRSQYVHLIQRLIFGMAKTA